jgi:hypothetical protein
MKNAIHPMKKAILGLAIILVTGSIAAEEKLALGIGGLFFRSSDPATLGAWYTKHMEITPVPSLYEREP